MRSTGAANRQLAQRKHQAMRQSCNARTAGLMIVKRPATFDLALQQLQRTSVEFIGAV
jgi:hypothetical protein